LQSAQESSDAYIFDPHERVTEGGSIAVVPPMATRCTAKNERCCDNEPYT
jgi:hypothetical protein